MIERVKGKKHPDDEIILFNGHAPSFLELLETILLHVRNEDNIYPPPKYKGGAMLQEFFIKYIGERRMPSDDELKELRLGKYRP